MKYKMIVMDMDGTLLSSDKSISDKNRSAIEKAYNMGVKIVISTGRMFASAKVYGEMIGVDTPIIASNGAFIRDKDKDEVIFSKMLGEQNIREILRITKNYNLNCHLFTFDTVFSEKLEYTALNYNKWNKALPEDKRVKICIINASEWDAVINEYSDKLLKAVVVSDNTECIIASRQEISKLNVEIVSSWINNYEVMNKGVSKGNAVDVLAKYYNIDKSEIICMGDHENDISMIEYAGLGVAMGNATEDTKNAASFITLTNNDDGVAYVIEKFILNPAENPED